MVTKRRSIEAFIGYSSVLAKILMVTKLVTEDMTHEQRSVLAKILMVTKLNGYALYFNTRSVLAKILMVTKHT